MSSDEMHDDYDEEYDDQDIDLTIYQLVKGAPPRHEHQYSARSLSVSSTAPQVMLLKKVLKLFEQDAQSPVYLYAIGKSITKTVDLALEVKRILKGKPILEPMTYTVTLIDHYVPKDPLSLEPHIQRERFNSAMRIKIHFAAGGAK